MISTKGYFYFDHTNPKHNIRERKKSSNTAQQTRLNKTNQQTQPNQTTKMQERIIGVVGRSYSRKYHENNLNNGNVFTRFRRKSQFRLTFQKLQQILSNSTAQWNINGGSNSRMSFQYTNPEQQTQLKQFVTKNSFGVQYNNRCIKTPKNKQLKQCLFRSDPGCTSSRPRTTLSRTNKKNHSQISEQKVPSLPIQGTETKTRPTQHKQQSLIYPSMSGVFIPSTKLKNKSKSIKRYNTSYQSAS